MVRTALPIRLANPPAFMKIHFCDICNESVPEADFAKGKAFLRQGRVVCALCESLMTTEERSATQPVPAVAPGTPAMPASQPSMASAPAMTHVSATATAPTARAGQGYSGGGWIGMLALLLAGTSAWYFSGQVQDLEKREAILRSSQERRLREVGRDLDAISLRAQEREAELEGRLRAGFNERHSETEAELETLREELLAAQKHQTSIDAELASLGKLQRESDIENGRRLDDLLAQSMKSRQTLDSLATRIDQSEITRAAAVAAAPLQVEAPAGPKYAAEMADLVSDTAGTRWNAVQSLGETGDPEVVPHLVPLLKDSDVFVRMAVARVCGDLASPDAVEPLIDALEDEEPVVREAAMAALHIITGRDFRFDPNGKPPERAKRIKAWRDWWKKAKTDFFGDL